MTPEENKARMRYLIEEVQNKGRIELVDELLADDFVNHTPLKGQNPGREGVKEYFGKIRSAFPDHDAVVEYQVAERDKVATYKSFNGTHQGEWYGLPPTGKKIRIRVFDLVTYRDGKITEHWVVFDEANLRRQIGALPE